MVIAKETIKRWLRQCDAYWSHDGNPKKPHAELTSGKCSNIYFNCPEVLKNPGFNKTLAETLVGRLREKGIGTRWEGVNWVIGSSYLAITFSYEVARLLGAIHGFPEKEQEPKSRKMLWRRITIPRGATVLQIEGLIATGQTFQEVRRAVEEGNAYSVNFFPIVGTIIHQPPKLPVDYGKQRVISLLEQEVWTVEQEDCQLCKQGSLRFKPETHWKELTRC